MPPTSTTAWEQYFNRELRRTPLLGTWVNRVRTTCSGQFAPHEKKRALVATQCGYREPPQSPGGGVLSQVMPPSVILKTVAPTRVALGLGSM